MAGVGVRAAGRAARSGRTARRARSTRRSRRRGSNGEWSWHATASVEFRERLDQIDERIHGLTHVPGPLRPEDGIGRHQESLPPITAERAGTFTAERGRQPGEPPIGDHTGARRLRGLPEDEVEESADDEIGLLGEMDEGIAMDGPGRAEQTRQRGPIRAEHMRRLVHLPHVPVATAELARALRGLADAQPDTGVRDDVRVSGHEVGALPARLVAGDLASRRDGGMWRLHAGMIDPRSPLPPPDFHPFRRGLQGWYQLSSRRTVSGYRLGRQPISFT